MMRVHALCVLAVLAIGCDTPHPLAVPTGTPDAIRSACSLTSRKCSGCHELDRILGAHHSAGDWTSTVDRMRALPGSAISEHDASIIMTCLVYLTVEPATPPPVAPVPVDAGPSPPAPDAE